MFGLRRRSPNESSNLFLTSCIFYGACSYVAGVFIILLIMFYSTQPPEYCIESNESFGFILSDSVLLNSQVHYSWNMEIDFLETGYSAKSRCGFSQQVDVYFEGKQILQTKPVEMFMSSGFYIQDCSGEAVYTITNEMATIFHQKYSVYPFGSHEEIMVVELQSPAAGMTYDAEFFDSDGSVLCIGYMSTSEWELVFNPDLDDSLLFKSPDLFITILAKLQMSLITTSSLMDMCNFMYLTCLDYVIFATLIALVVGIAVIYLPFWNT